MLKGLINSKLPNAFPLYKKVLDAKKRCYPLGECITESSTEIELQCLLDHTTFRILESQKVALQNVDMSKDFVLFGKWGFGGSTGHSEYKQKFSDSSIGDDSLFVTSYCPLQLICKSTTSDPDQVVWKNPRPSSTRFCRPEVIEHTFLSIGELSEEAAESRNKLVKRFRRDNTRKMTRVVTNTDLMNSFLLNSASFSSLRKLPRKKKSVLPKEVLFIVIII